MEGDTIISPCFILIPHEGDILPNNRPVHKVSNVLESTINELNIRHVQAILTKHIDVKEWKTIRKFAAITEVAQRTEKINARGGGW
jgi:hypothetical protein